MLLVPLHFELEGGGLAGLFHFLFLLDHALWQARHRHLLRYFLRSLQHRDLVDLLLQLSLQLRDLLLLVLDQLLLACLLLRDLVPQTGQVRLKELQLVFVILVL